MRWGRQPTQTHLQPASAMSPFSSAPSRGSQPGLFSPGQLRTLMRIEFDRCQRYGYPLVLLLIALDRRTHLQDFYGVEARELLEEELRGLARSASRASDFIGFVNEGRLMILVPHTPPDGAVALAKRILEGARRMRLQADGRVARATVSIGGAYNLRKVKDLAFDTLVEVAEGGLAVAQQAGGDRFVHSDLYEFFEQRKARETNGHRAAAVAVAPAAQVPARALAGLPAGVEDGSLLGSKIREMFGLPEADLDLLRRIEQEVIARVLRELKSDLERGGPEAPSEGEAQRQIELLERRIAKLTEQLGMTEEQLQKVLRAKSVDPGLSSIYDSVQGLSHEEVNAELKRALLGRIFEANVALRQSLTPGKSPP